MIENKNNKKKKNDLLIRTIILGFIVLAFCCTFFFKTKLESLINYNLNRNALSSEISEDGVKIHFVDVDQADCSIIELPNDEIMIIDTGDSTDESKEKLVSYLETIEFKKENNEPVVDYLILTHPHADHIGNADYIFENYLVKKCYLPQIYYFNEENPTEIPFEIPSGCVSTDEEEYLEVLNLLKLEMENFACKKIYTSEFLEIVPSNVEENSKNMWRADFYAPVVGKVYTSNGEADPNNYSPIMIFNYQGKKVLFTGDIEAKAEKHFLQSANENQPDLSIFDVDVLHVAHHGSKGSSTEDFLNLIKAEYAIIPVGENSYGHPTSEAINRLIDSGINEKCVYRTDINGNILLGISEEAKLSLVANHVQYVTFEVKLWQIVIVGIGVSAIIIYFPYIRKIVKIKKSKAK